MDWFLYDNSLRHERVNGSVMWTGTFWRSEPIHLHEQVPPDVLQIFIYMIVYNFSKPSEETVWF